MTQRLIVNVSRTSDRRHFETHVYDSSPINIGNDLGCNLRLDAPGVLRSHGLIFFGPSSVKYFDLQTANSTFAPPLELCCEVGRVVRIGPFEIAAFLEDARPAIVAPPDVRCEDPCAGLSRGLADVITSIVSTVRAVPLSDADLMAGFTCRAITILDAVSDALVEWRPQPHASWRPRMTPPRLDSTEVVECLMDPATWEARFENLRSTIIDVVRWESLALATAGSA